MYAPFLKGTPTSQDFVTAVAKVVGTDPEAQGTFILDGLNTHKSAELVGIAADRCSIERDLGRKGRHGVLKNMESRPAFHSDESHRIRLVCTPRHCSWVNQIEIYFSVLSSYVDQNNLTARPYNRTYTGTEQTA